MGYFSRLFKGAELNYTITEKECMAVVICVKSWQIYLYRKEFTIITDHSALKWILTIKDPQGRLARWSIVLSMYEFIIIHRAGRIHSNVDALSRPVLPPSTNVLAITYEPLSPRIDVFEDEPLLFYIQHGRHLPGRPRGVINLSLIHI